MTIQFEFSNNSQKNVTDSPILEEYGYFMSRFGRVRGLGHYSRAQKRVPCEISDRYRNIDFLFMNYFFLRTNFEKRCRVISIFVRLLAKRTFKNGVQIVKVCNILFRNAKSGISKFQLPKLSYEAAPEWKNVR